MTTPPRRPWPIADRDGPNPYASVTSDYGPEVDRYVDKIGDFGRAALPYVPIAGPAYDTYNDLREGDYAGAAFNGLMLAADLSPIGPYAKALKLLKRVNEMRTGKLLVRAKTQTGRVRTILNREGGPKGISGAYEIHHTYPVAKGAPFPGANKNVEGLWRNHPLMLKPLPKDVHRRLTGKWGDQPQFGPAMRAWHGTNAVQKSSAGFVVANAADAWENNSRPTRPAPAKQRR